MKDKKFYTEVYCPSCYQRLRTFRRSKEYFQFGCSNKVCNMKWEPSEKKMVRINPYLITAITPDFINEYFYGDTNPIFGGELN